MGSEDKSHNEPESKVVTSISVQESDDLPNDYGNLRKDKPFYLSGKDYS